MGLIAPVALLILAAGPPLALSIPVAPAAVESDCRALLVYELRLANDGRAPVRVDRVTITDPATREVLADYDGKTVTGRLTDVASNGLADGMVPPGKAAALFVEIATAHAPARLSHRVGTAELTQAVSRRRPVTLAPPLGDGNWVAVHAPEWPRGHRRVFYTVGGKPRLPGRFAIDFVGVDTAGRTTRGDPDRADAAVGYGAAVLAGADAVVARVRDGEPESSRISANGKHAAAAAAGNFVALALGGGQYAIYEHLRPGSVRVRPGQRVRQGSVIGELGFSGSSTGPHLHLHVADSPDPVGGEGLPFVIRGYTRLGRYADIGTLGSARWLADAAPAPAHDWPGVNVVVRFAPSEAGWSR